MERGQSLALLPPDKQRNTCTWLIGSGVEWGQSSALLPPDEQRNACTWLVGSGMERGQPSALLPPDEQRNACTWLVGSGMEWGQSSALLPPDEQRNACTWLVGSGMEWGQPSALLLFPGCWRCLNLLWSCSLEPCPRVGTISISFQAKVVGLCSYMVGFCSAALSLDFVLNLPAFLLATQQQHVGALYERLPL